MRDSISLTVYYDAKLDLSDSVVIALSQSGETPDVVEYVKRARGKGAFTVAITNGAESSLADAADATLALAAGPERAVAASKTFLNTLAALAWVAGGAAERGRRDRGRAAPCRGSAVGDARATRAERSRTSQWRSRTSGGCT